MQIDIRVVKNAVPIVVYFWKLLKLDVLAVKLSCEQNHVIKIGSTIFPPII